MIVSIGTGQSHPVKIHGAGPKRVLSVLAALIARVTGTDISNQEMEELKHQNDGLANLHYRRFNLPAELGLGDKKLDEWKKADGSRFTKHGRKRESTIEKIRRLTQKYCAKEEVQDAMDEVATHLVRHRQARCNDERKWELWATGNRYRCTVSGCDKSQKLRPFKDDLRDHIRSLHLDQIQGKVQPEAEVLELLIQAGTCPY
ncbi:hypothetical protein T440DRAFT_510683 [Plenodomus tracheiphilus IPT5]|uniref:Uncharacterized protein n=1 Tax=Plenodomus tracheiphilus IPT5 TaxID=1408161 RepID=A0A6A7AUF7_9PLEO|nr:hypothetical protein T440DRAFT_510683 [Plenodomus tracheiphilus IPT5]